MQQESLAILFLYLVDRQKFGKIIKDMENDVLQKKNPFPKNAFMVGIAILSTEANDGVAFDTMSEDKEEP